MQKKYHLDQYCPFWSEKCAGKFLCDEGPGRAEVEGVDEQNEHQGDEKNQQTDVF